jgi:hypothetical protein
MTPKKRKPLTLDQAGNVLKDRYLSGSELAQDEFSNPDANGNTGDATGAVTITVGPAVNDWLKPPKVYIVMGLAAVLAYAMYRDSK